MGIAGWGVCQMPVHHGSSRSRTIPAMRALALMLLLPVLWLSACGRQPPEPEAQVRALVTEAREAAEARDLARLRALIPDDYRDDQGRDKGDLVNILRLVFLRHQSVHLLTRVQDIDFPEPGRATLTVYVAMAGRPFPEQEIGLLRADLHRFDVTLRDAGGGRWQAVDIAWRRPERSDWPF
jgi:hypothetical protein